MRHLTALALAVLAGCATTAGDLRQREARDTFQGARAPAAIAACIAERVRRVGSPSIYTGAGGETVVSFHQAAATTLLVTIDQAKLVTVRRVNGLIPYRSAVQGCL